MPGILQVWRHQLSQGPIITLDHGSGGLKTKELIEGLFLKHLKDPLLGLLEDSAVLKPVEGPIAFTTDSYVVDPITFPGGDIGSLAIHGTINDLAMKGAWPVALSLSFILEEGLSLDELKGILQSIEAASNHADVPVVTGDTKVVPRGSGDKIFINTSGIGLIQETVNVGWHRIEPGDAVLCSGTIGDHGITILTQREGLKLSGDLKSDTAPLHFMVKALIAALGKDLHCMRDPTRGGVATVLVEIAGQCGRSIEVFEESLPIREAVRGATDILGLDPLYLANEGQLLAWVKRGREEEALEVMKSFPEGQDASMIGKVLHDEKGRVILNTAIGGQRVITALTGNPLPRIC